MHYHINEKYSYFSIDGKMKTGKGDLLPIEYEMGDRCTTKGGC